MRLIPLFKPSIATILAVSQGNLATGTRYTPNTIALMDGQYNGVSHSGHTIELAGDGKLEVPVASTLGSEEIGNVNFDTDTWWIKNNGATIVGGQAVLDNAGGYTNIRENTTLTEGLYYNIVIDIAEITSGDLSISAGASNYAVSTPGIHTFTLQALSLDSNTNVLVQGTVVCKINSVSYREIQSVEGTILYYDADAGKHVQIAGDSGLGSENLVVNGDFSDGDNGWGNWPTAFSVVNEELVNSGAVKDVGARQANIAEVGKRYVIQADVFDSSMRVQQKIGGNWVFYDFGVGIARKVIVDYVEDESTLYIIVDDGGNASRADNISMKEILDLSTVHTFENQKIGHFISLSAGQYFTEADIALIDAQPEILTAWALGETTGLSIVKHVDDAYYSVTEDGVNVIRTDGYTLGADLFNDSNPSLGSSDEISVFDNLTRNSFDLAVTTVGTNTSSPQARKSLADTQLLNTPLVQSFDIVVNSGDAILTSIYIGGVLVNLGKVLKTGLYSFAGIADGINNREWLRTNGTNLFNISVTNWTTQAVVSGHLTITGSYTRNSNSPIGLQTTLLQMNDVGVPIASRLSNTLHMIGSDGYIDTQWKPDGIRWSIEEKVKLVSGVTESRVLTHQSEILGEESASGGTTPNANWTTTAGASIGGGLLTLSSATSLNVCTVRGGNNIPLGTYRYEVVIDSITEGGFFIMIPDGEPNTPTGVGSTPVFTSAGTYTGTIIKNTETGNDIITPINGGVACSAVVSKISIIQEKSVYEDKYYIDTIEQATPALPDPAQTLKLGNVCAIGAPDAVDERLQPFNVHSVVVVP